MRQLAPALFALAALAGCASGDNDPDAPEARTTMPASEVRKAPPTGERPAAAEIAASFRELTLMTEAPVAVSLELALDCAYVPSEARVEQFRKRDGPHTGASVNIYMNDLAAAAFRGKSTEFPVGAVVVKEKIGGTFARGERDEPAAEGSAGVGGMIKRAAGYDPGHGDWEYFYFEDPAKVESGRIQSCVQCHAGAANTDHVFGQWSASFMDRVRRL